LAVIPNRRRHRAVFACAALYNVAWGLYTSADPQWLFRFAGLPLLNQPSIMACLAMVIGLYGVLYAEVARRPERGFLLAAVGLAGKVLGPIGMAVLLITGAWPPRAAVLCLTNDLMWWIPFALYLRDSWPWLRDDLLAVDR
jgi:hypothetical protein